MDAERQETIKINEYLQVVAKLYVDEYGFQDFGEIYGEFSDKEEEFSVDTKRGFVLGQERQEPEEPEETDFDDPQDYDAAYDKWWAAMDEYEENPYELLYETGYDYQGPGHYRFFAPDDGLTEMYNEAVKAGDKQEVERCAELLGKMYARIKDYGNFWNLTLLEIAIIDNGAVVGQNITGGLESDMAADDWASVTRDCVWLARDELQEALEGVDWEKVTDEIVDAVLTW